MFYVYEKSSTYIMGKPSKYDGVVRPDHRQVYKSMAAAKAAVTRMSKAWAATKDTCVENNPVFRYAIAEAKHFHANIEKQVKRTVMGTDNEYMEGVNTPVHMSPASETYWSM